MKKRMCILLCLLALFAFAITGCGSNSETTDTQNKNENTAATATPVPTEEVTPTPPAAEENPLTSLELTALMGNGINLGNTMEAYGRSTLGTSANVSAYETFWGQPVTTQEIISSMKEAGFDSIRIPVAWTNMMNFETGDYTIGSAYLDRVEEIVNYALNCDMYVIVNDHWDGGWWGMFGSATPETREAAMNMYISMWTQIGERFKDYSYKLIFEGANEELGNRLNDIDICADSGTLDTDECYEMTNKINQVFVDTIRGIGGNNEQRFLLIPGYGTDIDQTCDDRFKMPADTAKDKLLISVHYYTPWGYCGNTSLSTWGSSKNYEEMNTNLEKMTKFTEQGYGVIIGEYTVSLTDKNTIKENSAEFFENFLDNCDYHGYCPMLWDTSSQFVRKDLKFLDEGVAEVFAAHSLEAQSEISPEDVMYDALDDMKNILRSVKSNEGNSAFSLPEDKAVAWLMFNSSDWAVMYSVGDTYDPTAITDGMIATDAEVTGAGTYTVGLDFTGTGTGFANSTVFAALAIANGETLFPDYIINITDIQVNGESYSMVAKPYTTSDDAKCTRVNLYNSWVTAVPDGVRTIDGSTEGLAPCILDAATLGNIETLYITFEYIPAE